MIEINQSTKALPLKKGDSISAIAISTQIEETNKIIEGLQIFKNWGLICQDQILKEESWGYLAGKDDDRFRKLHKSHPANLITFQRGGWGAARLLERTQPWTNGWVVGFSDLTSILLSRLSAGFDGCIHGPILSSIADEPTWSQDRLRKILFGESIPNLYGESWSNGIAKGQLVAANLTVATHLIGTPHMPNLKGTILVLEDIGEEPYRIDRMLTHWRIAGILEGLAGICFGNFINCEAPKDISKNKTFQLNDILKERVEGLQIPIISGLPVGHSKGNAALPLGREVTINANKGLLEFNSR